LLEAAAKTKKRCDPMQSADSTYHIIRGTVLLLLGVGLAGWSMVRALKRSEAPPLLVFKWVLTALVIGLELWKVAPAAWGNPFFGIPCTAAAGLVLAIIWRHNIASIIAGPFASLYDGGDAEVEPRPFYSIAEAKRKRGQYTGAVAEIRKQLDKFPTDLSGQMMLAEIQAENLNDLPGAEITIRRLCAQPGHPPRNIALALYSLADWHLRFAQDRDAARQDLQQVIDLFPDTELSLVAAQRIAHLADTGRLLEPHDRQPLAVPEGVKYMGLLQSSAHLRPAETDPATLASDYVKHLEQHPLDTEAREKLAVIYADHFGRLDLAADQLGQLIEQPNQPGKLVMHWLNLLADLQLRHGADHDTVHQTLEQIVERYPNLAAAEIARNRMALLKLEVKAKEKSRAVKLGSYEQNIGLKRGLPHKL
jgi:tetratricopeptide (TPR) repeat protein